MSLAHYISIMPDSNYQRPAKLARKPWTDEESAWLQENYARLGRVACAAHLHRTPNSIKTRAQIQGWTLKGHYSQR